MCIRDRRRADLFSVAELIPQVFILLAGGFQSLRHGFQFFLMELLGLIQFRLQAGYCTLILCLQNIHFFNKELKIIKNKKECFTKYF